MDKFQEYLNAINRTPTISLNMESSAKNRDLQTGTVTYKPNSAVAYLGAYLGAQGMGGLDQDAIAKAFASKGLLSSFSGNLDNQDKSVKQAASQEVARMFQDGTIDDIATEYLDIRGFDTSNIGSGGYTFKQDPAPASISTGNSSTSNISSIKPPLANLQPGQTSSDVLQLQKYLVSIGLMTQAEVNTGPGTYGPKTTAAVNKLQQSLGVDNSTGPGYWGPRTIEAVASKTAIGGVLGAPSSVTSPEQAAGIISQAAKGADVNDPIFNTPEAKALSPDKLELLKAAYGAANSADPKLAGQIQDALDLILKNSAPALQAQIKIVKDSLTRSFLSEDEDLSFKTATLTNKLDDLRTSTTDQKDFLTIEEQQDLKNLETKYQNDLEGTRQNLAASGKTVSSARINAEKLLRDSNEGLVESTKRNFAYKAKSLTDTLGQNERDTAMQIDYYRQLATRSKIDSARSAEEQIGTSNLPSMSGVNPLGDIVGSLPSQNYQQSLSGALNFVF